MVFLVRRRPLLALGLFAFLALGSSGVSAPRSAYAVPLAEVGGEALDITADRLEVDVAEGTAALEGNVRAAMGDLEVFSPKIEIRYDEAPRVKWARGSGGVRAKLKGIEATAHSIELDVVKRRVTLRGGVRLTRGKGWVKATKASIDLSTRKVTLHEVKGSIPVEPPKR
jgi:lipopolysaccharide transport protein LptA